jgi:hypothetical protein
MHRLHCTVPNIFINVHSYTACAILPLAMCTLCMHCVVVSRVFTDEPSDSTTDLNVDGDNTVDVDVPGDSSIGISDTSERATINGANEEHSNDVNSIDSIIDELSIDTIMKADDFEKDINTGTAIGKQSLNAYASCVCLIAVCIDSARCKFACMHACRH